MIFQSGYNNLDQYFSSNIKRKKSLSFTARYNHRIINKKLQLKTKKNHIEKLSYNLTTTP